jgi:hypothetical protein
LRFSFRRAVPRSARWRASGRFSYPLDRNSFSAGRISPRRLASVIRTTQARPKAARASWCCRGATRGGSPSEVRSWLIGAGIVVVAILAAQAGVSGQDQEPTQHDGGAPFQPIAKPCTSPDSVSGVPSHRSCKERVSIQNAHYDPDCPDHWHIGPPPGWDIWQCMSSCEADLGRCEASCQILKNRMNEMNAPETVSVPFGRAVGTA